MIVYKIYRVVGEIAMLTTVWNRKEDAERELRLSNNWLKKLKKKPKQVTYYIMTESEID